MYSPSAEHMDSLETYGVIGLWGVLTEEAAAHISESIVRINRKRCHDCIQMIISSPGGSLMGAFGIVDLIAWSKLPVFTTGLGLVASAALTIFSSGAPGHRVLLPNASVLSHRFSTTISGNHAQILADRKHQDILHDRLVRHVIEHSKLKTREQVEALVLREVDTWLTAEEAVEMGFADAVYSADEQTGGNAE